MNKTNISPAVKLESKPCSRCGGEGKLWHFSNVICFKCNGAKNIFTKRGAAANAHLVAIRSVRADTLKVGDLVREQTMAGPNATVNCFMTVESIRPATPEDYKGHYSVVNGQQIQVTHEGKLKVELLNKKWGGLGTEYACDKLVRVGCSAEFKTATLRQALAYQATLAKTGKPTKATEAFLASNPSAKLPANILEKKI